MKRGIFFSIVFIVLINVSSASYISGDIYINPDGLTRFDVRSDVPLNIPGLSFDNNKIQGLTDLLTKKENGIWTFQLNLQNYNNTLLEIHLPKNLKSIVSIQGKDYLFDLDTKTITLLNSNFNFQASFILEKSINYSWIYTLILILLIVASFPIYKKIRKRKEHLRYIMPLINENEQKIIDLLMKSPKRQKEIRKALNIPKASFSRYLINLEKKKLIIREGEGKNKVARLK